MIWDALYNAVINCNKSRRHFINTFDVYKVPESESDIVISNNYLLADSPTEFNDEEDDDDELETWQRFLEVSLDLE